MARSLTFAVAALAALSKRAPALLVAAVTLSSCGGASPAGPSGSPAPSPTRVTFTVIDPSGAPILDARVTTALGNGLTDANGKATLDVPPENLDVLVEAAGYYGPYETLYGSARTTLVLFKVIPPSTELIVDELLFGGPTAAAAPPQRQALFIYGGNASLVVDPNDDRFTPALLNEIVAGLGPVTALTGAEYPVGSHGGPVVELKIGETVLGGGAQMGRRFVDGLLVGGVMTFQTAENVRAGTVAHEMGHFVGFYHHGGNGFMGFG